MTLNFGNAPRSLCMRSKPTEGSSKMFVQTANTTVTRSTQGFATESSSRDLCLISGHPELSGATCSYRHDTEIYGEDERVESFYKVVSGAVRIHKLLSDGRRQIGAFHFAG